MKYQLPIDPVTLAHFYSRAYIAPIAYMKKGHFDSFQSKVPYALLLTQSHGVVGCLCYLVVELLEDEVHDDSRFHQITDNFFLYTGALPISRVDEIVFADEGQKQVTIENVRMGEAFVPEDIIHIDKHFEQVELPIIQDFLFDKNEDLANSLKEFNRIMGALAFMRLAKERGSSFGDNFLQLVAMYSPYHYELLTELNLPVDCKFSMLFNNPKWSEYLELFRNFISVDTVKDYARSKKINIKIDAIKGYDFDDFPDDVKFLALTQNYSIFDGDGGRDKIDDLILNGFYSRNGIELGKAESFAFYYGYNRGYAAFRNEYRLDKKCVAVTFKLDNVFDLYLIEGVFGTIVSNRKDGHYAYLDQKVNCIAKKITDEEFVIFDQRVVIKKQIKLQEMPPSPVCSEGSSTRSSVPEGWVDERNALLLILVLSKSDRKALAKRFGLAPKFMKEDKKITTYLLKLPYEKLEAEYASMKKESPVKYKITKKQAKQDNREAKEVTLFSQTNE